MFERIVRDGRRRKYSFQFTNGTIGQLSTKPPPTTRPMVCFSPAAGAIRVIKPVAKIGGADCTYTLHFNSWVNAQKPNIDRIITEHQPKENHAHKWKVIRYYEDVQGIVTGAATSTSMSKARNIVDYMMCCTLEPTHKDIPCISNCRYEGIQGIKSDRAEVQMEKETMQGLPTQESDKQENTIITRDEARTDSRPESTTTLLPYVSSERYASFEGLTNRWVPMHSLEVRTANATGSQIKTYRLPKDIFRELQSTPNLIPFESYLYSHMEIEMKFVVNANKFQCGKVICSTKFDSFEASNEHSSVENALCRPHVILDLSTNNEGNLKIPFRFRRALLRNTTHEEASQAVRTSEYAMVYIQVLSQLRTGADGQNQMNIRPYVRFSNLQFAGMSFRAQVQMEAAAPLLGTVAGPIIKTLSESKGLPQLLQGVEKFLDTAGNSNCDKPTQLTSDIVIPHARMNFATGKGPTDAQVLRVNPTVMTPNSIIHSADDEPKDLLQIARVWGLRNYFTWSKNAQPGDLLARFTVDPTSRRIDQIFEGTPTPVEYISAIYNFWSGTLEMRLDFVSNAFHTGAIMVCVEFGRPASKTNSELSKAASTYTQTFHLGEQKSLTVTIPYIYDTVWRRSTALPFNPEMLEMDQTNDSRIRAIAIRPRSYTQVAIRVVNSLRPPETVSGDIDVQVFLRAGPSYRVHSLKQSSAYNYRSFKKEMPIIDDFPLNYGPDKGPTQEDESNQSGAEAQCEDEIAECQMDSGEKETQDPTQDFNPGIEGLTIQTHDPQTNIKDILRRPTLMFLDQDIEPYTDNKNMGFFIPIMPPSKMFAHQNGRNNEYSELLGQTPSAHIVNMFRHWRGSSRYTIVINGNSYAPIYATYVPHSGTRFIGNNNVGLYTSPKLRPIFASGLSTEIIIPQVNPTAIIECPYETTNNWTLTFEDSPDRNYTWRDKGDTTCGHIVLSSPAKTNFSAWWSAGDDFCLSNFFGIPKCVMDDPDACFDDEKAVTQAEDFQWYDPMNISSSVSNTLSGITPSGALTAAASSLPVVGNFIGALSTQATLNAVKTRANTTLDNVDVAANTATELMQSVQQGITPICDNLNALLELAIQKVQHLTQGLLNWTKYFSDLTLGISISIATKSYLPIATQIITFLKDFAICNIGAGVITEWSTQLTGFFNYFLSDQPRTQAAPSKGATIVGLLTAIVGTVIGVTLNTSRYTGFTDSFAASLTNVKTFSYMNSVIVFVTRIFDTLKEMIIDAVGMMDEETRALKHLVENKDAISNFIVEAQFVTSEENKALRMNVDFRQRYFIVVLQALQIQRAIIMTKGNDNMAPLMRFVDGILKKSVEHRMDLKACPIKIVPFVMTIEGESGIGKSFLMHDLAMKLHEAIQVNPSSGGTTYTYQSGATFWNNYSGQHVIVVDDYAQRTDKESIKAETDALFNLVTDAPFNPPMASLEDKKNYANPFAVVLLTNSAFAPHITTQNFDKRANLRRRGVIFHASLKSKYKGIDVENIDENILKTFAHLEFRMYKDNTDEEKGFYGKVCDYKTFLEYVTNKFQHHYTTKSKVHRQRLMELQRKVAGAGVELINVGDPYQILSDAHVDAIMTENSKVVQLEELRTMAQQILEIVNREYNMEQPITPLNPNPFAETQAMSEMLYQPFKTFAQFCSDVKTAFKNGATSLGVLLEHVIGGYDQTCEHCRRRTCCEFICPHENIVLCRTCVTNHRAMDTTTSMCPNCRQEGVRIYMCAKWLAIASISAIIASMGIDALILIFGRDVVLLRTCFTTLAWFLATRAFWKARNLRNETQAIGETEIGSASTNSEFADSWEQDYGDWPTENVQPQPTNMPIEFKVSTTEEIAQMCLKIVDAGLPCRHSALLQGVYSAVFSGGDDLIFRVVDNESRKPAFLNVSVYPCSAECPMSNPDIMSDFLARYVDSRHDELEYKIREYLNNPQMRDFIREQIPIFCRPTWMQADFVTPTKTWWDCLTDFYDKWKTVIKVIGAISLAFGAMLGFLTMFNGDVTESQYGATFSAGSERMYTPRTERTVYTYATKIQNSTKAKAQVQAEHSTLIEETSIKVFRNQVLFRIWKDDKCVRIMAGVGVRGRSVLIPKHYVLCFEKYRDANTRITIELAYALNGMQNHTRKTYNFDHTDFTVATDTDLAIMHLPPSYALFKDLVSLFWTNEDTMKAKSSQGLLIVPVLRDNAARFVMSVDLEPPKAFMRSFDDDNNEIISRSVIPYNYEQKGACGAILLLPHTMRPIATMHTCGVPGGSGYGVIITQELLESILPVTVQQMEDIDLADFKDVETTMTFEEDVNINYLGAVPAKQRPFMPSKSKFVPSPIHNKSEFKATTEPAILSSQDPRYKFPYSPLYYGVKKHGVPLPEFKYADIEEAASTIYTELFMDMKPNILNPKRLTIKEAIVGIPFQPGYEPMKLSTSAGYPWTVKKLGNSKLEWIKPILDKQSQMIDAVVDEELKMEIMRKEKLRKQGIVPVTIFCDTLKDERRKPDKVHSKGGTRVFCASPVDATIATRQNFLHFCAAIMKNRIGNSVGVGINPLGPEWTKLAHNLLAISPTNIMNMDYSNFGPGFHASVAWWAGWIMRRWTIENVEGVDGMELEALIEEFINSVHIAQGTVYQQTTGSPSGAAITVVMNSLVNLLYLALAWKHLAKEVVIKRRTEVWAEFFNHVYVLVYGDDFIASVSDDFKDVYNPKTITKYLQQYGIVATDATKEEEAKFKNLTEATFLKRGFKEHPNYNGMWLGPLEWRVIEEIPQWTHKNMDGILSLQATGYTALIEAHGHGPERYEEFKEKFNRAVSKLRKNKAIRQHATWESIDELWFKNELFEIGLPTLAPGEVEV